MLTLNQVIDRIRLISLAHKQVRSFIFSAPSDFLVDRKTSMPGIFLQDTPGAFDTSGKVLTVGFRMFALDLVNVSERAKENELEVQSDMLSVLGDLLAEFDHSSFSDWAISVSNGIELLREKFDDMVAGAYADVSVRIPWDKDTCAVPTEALPEIINQDDMKLVYDMEYIATGSEGSTFSPSAAVGKKILMIIRENNPLHKVSSSPDPAEFTWDDTNVGLGTPISVAGERFLILYRNY